MKCSSIKANPSLNMLFNTRNHKGYLAIITNMFCFADWELAHTKDKVKELCSQRDWQLCGRFPLQEEHFLAAQSKSRNEQQMTLEEVSTTP